MSNKNEIKKGALLSYLLIIINTIIGFLLTPFLLNSLGEEEYGIYLLIGSISSAMLVMDFGVKTTVIRYISKFIAEKKQYKVNEFLNAVFFLYMIIGVLVIIVGVVIYNYIEVIFASSISQNQLPMAKLMFLIVVINVALSLIMNSFPAIINAYERFTYTKTLDITFVLVRTLLIYIFISNGYSAVIIVLIDTTVNLIIMFLRYVYIKYILNLSFQIKKPNKNMILSTLSFSRKVFVSNIINQINTKLDQTILGIVSTASQVAISGIAITFVGYFHTMAQVLSGLFLPRITKLVSSNVSIEKIQEYCIKVSRIQMKILLLCLVGFILLGKEFISIWLGSEYENIYWIILVLMLGNILPYSQGVLLSLSQALNLHGIRNIIYFVISLLNILLTIPLAKSNGAIGAATATTITLFIGYGIFIQAFYHMKIKVNMWLYMKETIIKSVPVGLVVILLGSLINILISNMGTLGFISKIIMITCIYSILIWKFDSTNYEKKLFKGLVNRLMVIIRR